MNSKDMHRQLLDETRSYLENAQKDYDNRDMTGSKELYSQNKLELGSRVRSARFWHERAVNNPPGLKSLLFGAFKGSLFPVTVPYYVYRYHGDKEYKW
jgi:hypothetical protein